MRDVPQPGSHVMVKGEEFFVVGLPSPDGGRYLVKSIALGASGSRPIAVPVEEVDEEFRLRVSGVFRGVPVGVPFVKGDSAYVVVSPSRLTPISPDVEWETDDDPRTRDEKSAWVSTDELTDVTAEKTAVRVFQRQVGE